MNSLFIPAFRDFIYTEHPINKAYMVLNLDLPELIQEGKNATNLPGGVHGRLDSSNCSLQPGRHNLSVLDP